MLNIFKGEIQVSTLVPKSQYQGIQFISSLLPCVHVPLVPLCMHFSFLVCLCLTFSAWHQYHVNDSTQLWGFPDQWGGRKDRKRKTTEGEARFVQSTCPSSWPPHTCCYAPSNNGKDWLLATSAKHCRHCILSVPLIAVDFYNWCTERTLKNTRMYSRFDAGLTSVC